MIGLQDTEELVGKKIKPLDTFWRANHEVSGLWSKQNKDSEMHEQHT